MIIVDYDPAEGIIRSRSPAVLTVPDVRRYYMELRAVVARSRREWGDVRHIVDAVAAATPSEDVMQEFINAEDPLTGETDRAAILVANSLGKARANRNMRSERERASLSPDAAMTWLMAMPRRGAA